MAAVPVVVAAALTAALGAAGVAGAGALAAWLVDGASAGASVLRATVHVVAGAGALLVAFVVAISLAQPISGFALDGLVRAQERALGVPEAAPRSAWASFAQGLRVTVVAAALGLPALALLTALGLLVPGAAFVTVPLKFVVTALLLAWDFLDYPLGARGLGVRARAAWMRANAPAVLGFGVATAIALLVPCAGLLILPMAVAGAARLAAPPRAR